MMKGFRHKAGRKSLLSVTSLLITALVIVGVAALLSACGSNQEGATLEGSEWTLISLDGEGALAGSEITALFSEEKISGSAGCNSYFAGYQVESEPFIVGPIGSTMMMCSEPLMEQEMAYLAALETAESFSVDGDTLEIVYAAGTLTFISR